MCRREKNGNAGDGGVAVMKCPSYSWVIVMIIRTQGWKPARYPAWRCFEILTAPRRVSSFTSSPAGNIHQSFWGQGTYWDESYAPLVPSCEASKDISYIWQYLIIWGCLNMGGSQKLYRPYRVLILTVLTSEYLTSTFSIYRLFPSPAFLRVGACQHHVPHIPKSGWCWWSLYVSETPQKGRLSAVVP